MAALAQLTFQITEPQIYPQAIADTSTTAQVRLGTRVKGYNATDGVAEFIYLKGAASTIAGSWVTYNTDDFSTALIVADASGPVAVSMSANVASQYGWYMIFGKVDACAKDVADDGRVFIDTTAGYCDDAVVAGDHVLNAKWASADDTGVASVGWAEVEIAYPFVANITS